MRDAPLQPHQSEGIEWIHRVRRGLLLDEPGLGKSRTAIEAFDGGKVLVVAPAMVISGGTWTDELAAWAYHPEGFQVVPYSMLNARNGNTPNFGTAKHPRFKLRPEYEGHWDAVIVDEAHYTKGRKTSWTSAVAQVADHSDSVLEMTGTPMPNWAHELFTMLQVIRPEDAVRGGPLGSYWRWIGEWFKVSPSRHNPQARIIGDLLACNALCDLRSPIDPCEHFQQFAEANLGDRALRRLRDDVLGDLPPLTEQQIEIPLDKIAARYYRELKKDYLTLLEGNEQEVVAWTPGARNVMLDRITTSPWLLGMDGEPRGGKFDRLAFDLENRSRPTLVLAHYRDTVEANARVAESVGASAAVVHGGISEKAKSKAIADFKAGRLDVLSGSLETLAEGLTLTVADMAIFVERSYKPSRNEQAMRRVHRMGQTRPVTILDYMTPKTVDENKRELLGRKTDQQMRVMSAQQFSQLL
ncbi:helicase [Curtobacterium phage Parvaparticeps]|nr:helicase [Curtobacterium phage Parvaparticeps]